MDKLNIKKVILLVYLLLELIMNYFVSTILEIPTTFQHY